MRAEARSCVCRTKYQQHATPRVFGARLRQHGGDKSVARTLELSTRPRPRPVPPVHRGHLGEALKRGLVASIGVRNTRTDRIGPGGCWGKSGVLAPGTRAGAEGCGACHVPSVKWGSSGFGAAMPGYAWEGNVSLARMYAVAASCPPTPDPAIAGLQGMLQSPGPVLCGDQGMYN